MQEAIEIKGYWWLPDDEEKKLPGILTYSQEDGISLDLVGVFDNGFNDRVLHPAIILGISLHGKPLTLSRCSYSKIDFPITGVGSAKYRVHILFENVHFSSEADIKFHQLSGSYTDLDAWININNFVIEYENVEGKYITKIKYVKPDKNLIEVGEDYRVGIGFSSTGPSLNIIQSDVKISQQAYLIVESTKGDISFSSLFEKLYIFSHLLQLAIQRVPYTVSLSGKSTENASNSNGKVYYPEIKIYYQPIEAQVKQRQRLPQEMLFNFNDLDKVQINNWFSSYKTHEKIINLYRATFYSNRLFIETRFLNVVQALETLHSFLYGNLYIPTEEFRERKEIVMSLIPEEFNEWVAGALQNSNYKSFMMRIFELIKNKDYLFSPCISDVTSFARRVRDTRNELVHLKILKGSFKLKEELVMATRLLTIVFEVYLLEIIGFSNEKVNEIAQRQISLYLNNNEKF